VTTPFTVWFTGIPGSGKTSLARRLVEHLNVQERACALLDGDDVRRRTKDVVGFTPGARRVHVVYCAVAAAVLNEAGVSAAAALVSPGREARLQAREIVGENFLEVYLHCDPDVAKARSAKPDWAGVHVPYEPSEEPELSIDTEKDDFHMAFGRVLIMLSDRGL